MGVHCFLVTATGRFKLSLRRYCPSDQAKCPGAMSYHDVRRRRGLDHGRQLSRVLAQRGIHLNRRSICMHD